ncbi:hypothetical protein [Flavobacterium lindanitolerans]|uniref:hypothetical protein n=1 Tax=Flavobacterium lindanitolerans TaxID=428988 RepID=UPI0023F3FE4C|nr:hypothetical protein [Flavobacterium lindanitolerans]
MEKELPVVKIEGTEFLLDVGQLLLIEKGNPENTISFFEMEDNGNGYSFDYNPKGRNIPDIWDRHDENVNVNLLPLVEMDQQGMAEKYGLTVQDLVGKTDFDVMVDSKALEERLRGRLTTIDIADQIFYVDIPMGKLRPKDDFASKGIVFDDIDHCFDEEREMYLITYNPAKHEFEEVYGDEIIEVPKDLILIEFPHERFLDPVGYNRKHGADQLFGLKETSIKPHFTARIAEWKEVGLHELINENRKRLGLDKGDDPPKYGKRQRKGKGI